MLISNNIFSLTEGLFVYRAYCRHKEYIKSNFSKCWIKDLTDFKSLIKRIRNNIILLVVVIRMDLNKFKAYIIVVVKLTSELNTLLIVF